MNKTAPHYLLLTQAQSNPDSRGGIWRFVLEQIGSSNRIEVADDEPGVWGERLQLLAVVRGLEALDQPSRVTLISPSRFVGNGIRRGLSQWRESGWQWERFGQLIPVKHVDLWKRVDQTLQFHQVNCRIWDFDDAHHHAPVVQRTSARNRISLDEIESARKISFAESPTAQPRSAGAQSSKIDNGKTKIAAAATRKTETVRTANSASEIPTHRAMESLRLRNHPFSGSTRDSTAAPNLLLAQRVKPIGAGRAFGYAPS